MNFSLVILLKCSHARWRRIVIVGVVVIASLSSRRLFSFPSSKLPSFSTAASLFQIWVSVG